MAEPSRPLRGWSSRRRGCELRHGATPFSGRTSVLRGLSPRPRSRQLSGSRWSSTSSTVTAPSRWSSSSTTGAHTRLYAAKNRVTSARLASGDSRAISVSSAPATSSNGGSRSSRWVCTQPRYRPVGVACGGRQTNTIDDSAGRQIGRAHPGQRLGDRGVRGEHDPARASSDRRRCRTSTAAAAGPAPIPPAPSAPAAAPARRTGSSASRSAASSGSIASRMSAARASSRCAEQLLLVVLRQFLDDVGQPVVVQGVGHLVPARRRQVPQHAWPRRPARMPSNEASSCWAPSGRVVGQVGQAQYPRTSFQPSTWTGARRVEPAGPLPHGQAGDHPVPGPGPLHRRVDHGRRGRAVVASRTFLSISWPITSTSVGRCSNRRRLDRSGGQRDRVRLQRGDPQHRHEDRPAGQQLDHDAQHPRRLPVQPQRGDDVPDLADRFAVRAEHGQPGQLGDEDARGTCHGSTVGARPAVAGPRADGRRRRTRRARSPGGTSMPAGIVGTGCDIHI